MRNTSIWLVRGGFITALALPVWWLSELPLWACLMLSTMGFIVNGAIIDYEDELPGGWNNPNGTESLAESSARRKFMASALLRVFLALLALIALGVAIAFFSA